MLSWITDEETSESDDDNMGSPADEDIERIVKHVNIHHTIQERHKRNECAILTNGAKVTVEPDTSADVNFMD